MIYTLTESSSYACYNGFTKTALLIQGKLKQNNFLFWISQPYISLFFYITLIITIGINNGLNFLFCIYLSSIIGSKEKEPDTESNIGHSSRISNNNQ